MVEEKKEYDILHSYEYIHNSYKFLTAYEKLLLMTISGYNPCYASQGKLAKECPMSIAQVKRCIVKLIQLKILTKEKSETAHEDTYIIDRNKIKQLLDAPPSSTRARVIDAPPSSTRATPLALPELGPSSTRATLPYKVLKESIKNKVTKTPFTPRPKASDVSLSNAILILQIWNEQKIIKHNSNEEFLLKISKLITKKKMPLERIKTAILTYSSVINDDKYFWSYKWTLIEFLKREGANPFFDDDCPIERYLKKGQMSEKEDDSRWSNFLGGEE